MRREELIKILTFISKLEGFARGTHKNWMLPDDMLDEMEYVSSMLVREITKDICATREYK